MAFYLISKYLQSRKNSVDETLEDINLFYNFISDKGETVDAWFFTHVFTGRYYDYLQDFKFLSPEKLNVLHTGVLTILLFKIIVLSNENQYPDRAELQKIKRRISNFHPADAISRKLTDFIQQAISMCEYGYETKDINEIYRTIHWTMNNVIKKQALLNNNKR